MFFNKEQIDPSLDQQSGKKDNSQKDEDEYQIDVNDGQNAIIDFNEENQDDPIENNQKLKQVEFDVDVEIDNADVVDFNDDEISNEVGDEHTVQTVKRKKIDDENISQMSQRSRQDFEQQQKKQIKEIQKIKHDSPTKFEKNQSFFKKEDDDYSKYLKDEEEQKDQFQYEVKYTPAQLTPLKIDDEENESPIKQQNFNTEQQILHQSSSPEQQFDSPKKSVKFIDNSIISSSNSAFISKNVSNQQSQLASPKVSATSNDFHFSQRPLVTTIYKTETIPNIKQFVFTPVPHQKIMQFSVERDTSGTGLIYGKYHLYFSNPRIYLATAKRLAFQKTSQYVITTSKTDFSPNTSTFIGKLRSNFLGTEFMLYDNGLSPNETKEKSQIRQQLCLINYENNIMQTRMPKRSRIVMPLIIDNQIQSVKPTNPKEGLLLEQKNKANRNVTYYEFLSKNPVWNEKLQVI